MNFNYRINQKIKRQKRIPNIRRVFHREPPTWLRRKLRLSPVTSGFSGEVLDFPPRRGSPASVQNSDGCFDYSGDHFDSGGAPTIAWVSGDMLSEQGW
ncbi:hypothetical protein Hanom_Chr10g00957091 [Helianthus anomalus]